MKIEINCSKHRTYLKLTRTVRRNPSFLMMLWTRLIESKKVEIKRELTHSQEISTF